MTYYEQLKPKAEETVSTYYKVITDLQQQIPKIKKRLEDEKSNKDRLQNRIAKLQELSIESLTGGQNEYEKYKVSMKKLNNDLQVSEEIVLNIQTNILPNAKQRLQDSERNLKIKLNAFLLQSRCIADEKINLLMQDVINERQNFLDAFETIYSDYGLGFIVNDESFCPGIFSTDQIRDIKIRIGMKEPIPAQENAPTIATGEENASEGIKVPPLETSLPEPPQDEEELPIETTPATPESVSPESPVDAFENETSLTSDSNDC